MAGSLLADCLDAVKDAHGKWQQNESDFYRLVALGKLDVNDLTPAEFADKNATGQSEERVYQAIARIEIRRQARTCLFRIALDNLATALTTRKDGHDLAAIVRECVMEPDIVVVIRAAEELVGAALSKRTRKAGATASVSSRALTSQSSEQQKDIQRRVMALATKTQKWPSQQQVCRMLKGDGVRPPEGASWTNWHPADNRVRVWLSKALRGQQKRFEGVTQNQLPSRR